MLGKTLYIVVPCYNEEAVLRETAARLGEMVRLLAERGKASEDSRVLFVNDGSRDATWSIIEELCAKDGLFAGISLSRNRGHQNALLAGLMAVKDCADMAVSIDADLQDDVGAIEKMTDEFHNGCDIVYGVRSGREKDSFFKRLTAEGYYKMLARLGCEVVFNHADFRLMSARALAALSEFGEQSLYLRGIIPMLGFKTAVVEYSRAERFAGESKYPLKRMLGLAMDGVTSLSMTPLRLVTGAGIIMLLIAAALFIYSIVTLFFGETMLNWKIITLSVWGVGGVMLLGLGIVGEYVGRAYLETKSRPRYFIEKTAGLPDGISMEGKK